MRILDASANRAAEGLRTMEEYARFVLEDRHLSEVAKTLRHDLTQALLPIPWSDRLTARSVASDCGTTISLPTEGYREDAAAVARAAASRVQEAVRCLEEYGKTIKGFDTQVIESIRYRIYTFTATLALAPSRNLALRDRKLYLLIPATKNAIAFAAQIESLFHAGVDIIQLRDKHADDQTLYACAKIAADIARRLGKVFIVNDRADIAVAANASGVHVGQEELPVEAVRRVMGSRAIVGVSTHNLQQARAAVLDGADYIGCGPTFPSQTKSFDQFVGLHFLREVAQEITLPSYAIGGIDETNLQETMATGVHGVALASAILNADSPIDVAEKFRRLIDKPYPNLATSG